MWEGIYLGWDPPWMWMAPTTFCTVKVCVFKLSHNKPFLMLLSSGILFQHRDVSLIQPHSPQSDTHVHSGQYLTLMPLSALRIPFIRNAHLFSRSTSLSSQDVSSLYHSCCPLKPSLFSAQIFPTCKPCLLGWMTTCVMRLRLMFLMLTFMFR